MSYIDNIFGDTLEPASRQMEYQLLHRGVQHAGQLSPLRPQSGEPLTLRITTAGSQPFSQVQVWYSIESDADYRQTGGVPPSALDWHTLPARFSHCEWDTQLGAYVSHWQATFAGADFHGMVRYHIGAQVANSDEWVFADNQSNQLASATPFAVWLGDPSIPDWAKKAVVYQVFMDRFAPTPGQNFAHPDSLGGFFGGTLQGVIDRLGYIHQLGCTVIWLSPIFASPSHHGYDGTDYYQVEPRYGTHDDLLALIEKAKALGIRILLDFVANHWSHLHPTFQAALSDPQSEFHDWYTWRSYPQQYETFLDVTTLPKLNLAYLPARQYLLDCAKYWLEQGVAGFRLDFANGPVLDFWADFRRVCRLTVPDCWIFGEIIHSPATQQRYWQNFDGTLDFMLAFAMRQTFAQGQWQLSQWEAFLSQHEHSFSQKHGCPSFLDNHDMNRFLFLAHNDLGKLKIAALILFALPLPPILYAGIEVGVTQTRPIHTPDGKSVFEECRSPMLWGAEQNTDLLAFFRALIRWRAATPAMQNFQRTLWHLDDATGGYAFLCEGDNQRILLAVNCGDSPLAIPLPPGEFSPCAESQLRLTIEAGAVLVPARSGGILTHTF
jgi:glycosidase